MRRRSYGPTRIRQAAAPEAAEVVPVRVELDRQAALVVVDLRAEALVDEVRGLAQTHDRID